MSKIIKAPAILKGLQSLNTADLLANATDQDVKAMMGQKFALWAALSGVKVDGRPLEFDNHRYLLPIYMDDGHEVVWMKAAQLGATIYMLLRLLWFARYHTLKAGLYFPTGEGVEVLSKDRLAPLIDSNPELSDNVRDDADTLGLKGIDNIHGERSSLYMLYLGGKASKDSVPLDVIAFDEVRLVDPNDIEQALERISHSNFKHKIFMSTAGSPGVDIDVRFKRGTQLTWHSKCNCLEGVVLSDVFPECIVKTRKGEVYLRCPKCKYRINDPQNGNYLAHNPGADYNSYAVSQLVSKFITPKDIFERYTTTTNITEFYNAKLGRPYVDEEARPITEDVFNACINETLKWGSESHNKKVRGGCAMGVDQHSGNCYVTIMKEGRDGKKQLVHLELIERGNSQYWEYNKKTGEMGPVTPFKRLYTLMREYNVGKCVIDAMPNINEAYDLARYFPSKVFLAHYKDTGQDLALWYDRLKLKEGIKKGSTEIRMKWQVLLNRYTSMDYLLRGFTEGIMEIPPVGNLIQVCQNEKTGRMEAEQLALRFKQHLTRLVRQEQLMGAKAIGKKAAENTGKSVWKWVYLGGDPHFAHSALYANIALERLKSAPKFAW